MGDLWHARQRYALALEDLKGGSRTDMMLRAELEKTIQALEEKIRLLEDEPRASCARAGARSA